MKYLRYIFILFGIYLISWGPCVFMIVFIEKNAGGRIISQTIVEKAFFVTFFPHAYLMAKTEIYYNYTRFWVHLGGENTMKPRKDIDLEM